MFNLIMLSVEWNTGRATMPINRVFEYTEEYLSKQFLDGKNIILNSLIRLPCLFMQEGVGSQNGYVGQINRARLVGDEVSFEYTLDNHAHPIKNDFIFANKALLDMPHEFEFSRNHWAVKNVDIYRFLLHANQPRRQRPTVFQISEHEEITPSLVSAMMPFSAGFNSVYASIQQAVTTAGLLSRRADDIWENAAIIQDVVSLIDRSRIVVCDCTGKNPNVFYEAGIAHTLGREVILITQAEQDIPFDLRHLRYIRYLDNEQGRDELEEALLSRIQTILGH